MNDYLYYCHSITHVTTDIAKLVLRPVTEKLIYQAGQYVQIELPNGITLPLSIANAPLLSGELEFHLRHNHSHPQAQYLLSHVTQNKHIALKGPCGQSVLTQADGYSKLLFLAGGTGFAPIKALLSSALTQKNFSLIELMWGISHPIDGYEQTLLAKWQQAFPHFHYTLVLSNAYHYPTWKGATGLVHEYCMASHPFLERYCIFLSGPFAMIKSAQGAFKLSFCKLVSDLI